MDRIRFEKGGGYKIKKLRLENVNGVESRILRTSGKVTGGRE